ncbi:MAG: alpha-amylase family glycosyl hydrolase [Paludibacter sp.]
MKKSISFLLSLLTAACVFPQATTVPALPTENDPLVITFDINQCTTQKGTLIGYTGPIYAHIGAITTKSPNGTEWMSRIALWPDKAAVSVPPQDCNIDAVQLIPVADRPNVYTLTMPHGARQFFLEYSQENPVYQFAADEKITKIEVVLRNFDGSKDGRMTGNSAKNISIPIYSSGLNLIFTNPTADIFVPKNQTVNFTAIASQVCNLQLTTGTNTIATAFNATSITGYYQFVKSGMYTVTVTGTNSLGTSTHRVNVTVRADVISQQKPAGVHYGINYIDDNTVTLVLFAPRKEFIYAVGDFNNWALDNNYMMKKDGDDWWITLTGLEKGREYSFYYNIDGLFNVGDPYTNKVLDKANDSYIPASTYPNLKTFPTGATGTNMVSVFQTGQTPYNWQVQNFKGARQDQLIVYELLVRDFTQVGNGNGDFKTAMTHLDYLKSLGINAIELMPINEFDGNNSWGYNPAFYFAPDKAYGNSDDYKQFIDECHKRGIAVIQDLVLNHSYGQSPFCRLYAATPGSTNAKPAADNPWYNVSTPHTCYSWGADFNHESLYTKALVDSICSFWMSQYKVDGFRFDFTKGFTNTVSNNSTNSCGGSYDASRIAILKRMYDQIKKRNNNAYVILEHFCDASEEKELGNYGMMIWTRVNDQFYQSGMAVQTNSDFSGILAKKAGWSYDNKMGYMESHDEERTAYKVRNFGNLATTKPTTLQRQMQQLGLNAAFFFTLPGPKMVYEFGELGYDYSISSKRGVTDLNDGYRTDPKTLRWDYYDVAERKSLYDTYSKLLDFRKQYANSITIGTLTTNISTSDWPLRKIKIDQNDMSFLLVGNFDASSTTLVNPGLSGTWYDLMTGAQASTSLFNLPAGQFKIFTSKKVTFSPTAIKDIYGNLDIVKTYPNPVHDKLYFDNSDVKSIMIYNLFGGIVKNFTGIAGNSIDISTLCSGLYLTKFQLSNGQLITQKILIEK